MHSMLETVGLKGYEQATLGEVLGRAGVSTRVFELEFEGKEDCFLAAFDAEVERIETWLTEAVQDENDWLTKLRVGLGFLIDLAEAKPHVARAMFSEPALLRRVTGERWNDILGRAADFMDQARFEPCAKSPPQITSKAVVAKIYGMLRSGLTVGRPVRHLVPDLLFHAISPYFGASVAQKEMLAVATGRPSSP